MGTRLLTQPALLRQLSKQGLARITTQEACRQTKNLRTPPHVTVWVGEKSMWRPLKPDAVANLWDRRDGQRSLCNLLLRTVFHLNESQYTKLQARFSKPNDVVGIYKGPEPKYTVLVELPKNWVPSNGVILGGLGLVSLGLAARFLPRMWGVPTHVQEVESKEQKDEEDVVEDAVPLTPDAKTLKKKPPKKEKGPLSFLDVVKYRPIVNDRSTLGRVSEINAEDVQQPGAHADAEPDQDIAEVKQDEQQEPPMHKIFGSDMNTLIKYLLTEKASKDIELNVDLSQSNNVLWHIIATVAQVFGNQLNLTLNTTPPVECVHLEWVTQRLSKGVIQNVTIKKAQLTTTCVLTTLPENLKISSIGLQFDKGDVPANEKLKELLRRCDDAEFTLAEDSSEDSSLVMLSDYVEGLQYHVSPIVNFATGEQLNKFAWGVDDAFSFSAQTDTHSLKLSRK